MGWFTHKKPRTHDLKVICQGLKTGILYELISKGNDSCHKRPKDKNQWQLALIVRGNQLDCCYFLHICTYELTPCMHATDRTHCAQWMIILRLNLNVGGLSHSRPGPRYLGLESYLTGNACYTKINASSKRLNQQYGTSELACFVRLQIIDTKKDHRYKDGLCSAELYCGWKQKQHVVRTWICSYACFLHVCLQL